MTAPGSPRARLGELIRNLAVGLASVAVAFAIVEAVARAVGLQPYRPVEWNIRVEPDGRYQVAHPTLGYAPRPGHFTIHFGDGHTWRATHLADSTRITRPLATYPSAAALPGIWIFGCSFAHGWGLDDEETFAWHLQELLPDHEVKNFGVGGYGTLQSLLQLREALGRGPAPVAAVLAYGDFHDERNTRLRSWRKANSEYRRFGTTAQPYVRLGADGRLVQRFDDATYRDLFLIRHSAILNRIDAAWSLVEDRFVRSHEVSRRLIEELDREARAHGAVFVLGGIIASEGTREMLDWAGRRGIPATDLSVDLSKPGNAMAFDGHPSPRANRGFARKLHAFLTGPGGPLAAGARPGAPRS
jgi:hypothetical protein